ncbi:MAG: hypothetical protein ACTHU0_17485 [Kofleriaceae bacterium]
MLAIAVLGCGASARSSRSSDELGNEVTLYRDRALVRQRIEIEATEAGIARARVRVPEELGPDDVFVLERGGLTVAELRTSTLADQLGGLAPPEPLEQPADERSQLDPPKPREIELVVDAPRPGKLVLHLGYVVERLSWDAAYTITTTAARDHAVLRGALGIHNATGLAIRRARVRIVDAPLEASNARTAELLAAGLTRGDPAVPAAAPLRELGTLDLVDGETRIELLNGAGPRRMRSVLVYDPIGTALDHKGAAPVQDPMLGVRPPASPRVHESLEIARDRAATEGLPAGPVRLLERTADGALALLGEARLFESSTRVAEVDLIPIGPAAGVTGARRRRELTYDRDDHRLVEEFLIELDNARPEPVDVVIREHLYRSLNWTLAYQSAPVATKEGPQQVALRTSVPPKGKTNVLYVVVYTWP